MEAAIHIRGACKQYGANTKVLQGLNMTVCKGSIYALLGASGCGKTTLLSCIVGRRKLNAGEISVLGGCPGSKVEGPSIGYMPQDIGLIGEFSVKGALFYFGWLAGMSNQQIEDRCDFLSKLLDLPPHGRYVKNLSGGQQRRVSLAAALLHGAQLLILDEPTVGLDPVLRNTIWNHLVTITQDKNVTVIITTHYIEEARQAHVVGMMRHGILLAENSPQCLIDFYRCSTLEEVFLKLSIRQSREQADDAVVRGEAVPEVEESPPELPVVTHCVTQLQPELPHTQSCLPLSRMKALLFKNFLGFFRNPGELGFVVLLPLIQISLLFLAIGGQLQGLHLSVVNQELGNFSNCYEYLAYNNESGCDLSGISCKYLAKISDDIAMKDFYQDTETALETVRRGEATGALLFAANFSESLLERWIHGRDTSPSTIDSSEVQIHMDMSDEQIALMMQATFYEEFRVLGEEIAERCNWSVHSVRIPMQFNEPVYGSRYPKYQDFVAPGYIISVIYFLATILTTTVLIKDRKEGIWDRSLVAGVTVAEILWAHVLCQFVYVLAYSAEVIFLSMVVYGLQCKGSLITFALMVCLQGVSGMMYGLVISVVCNNYFMAIFIASGSLLPFICLTGVIWPVEGMHYLLRYASMCMPYTFANLSLSNVLLKGWSLVQPEVYVGFLVSTAWAVTMLLFCLLVLHFRK